MIYRTRILIKCFIFQVKPMLKWFELIRKFNFKNLTVRIKNCDKNQKDI